MTLTRDLRWLPPTAAFILGMGLISSDVSGATRIVGFALLVGVTVWGYLRLRDRGDEVVRAANRAAIAWGAPLGLALAFSTIFAVRYLPSWNAFVTETAAQAGAIGPEAAAFALGILFTGTLVVLATSASWAVWWLTKR